MPRHLVVGNGKLLVNLDQNAYIRDIYYPFVGQLNHVGGFRCRMGIWIDGQFSWLAEPDWKMKLAYITDSLVTEVYAVNYGMGITLILNDGVHQRDSIYLKRIKMINHFETAREVRLFFSQDLNINETEVGDTAVYYPVSNTIFHYKKGNYFMFNGMSGNEGIFQHTTGVKRFHGAEGTWKDAEDGILAANAISQGSVDSTISLRIMMPPNGQQEAYYWMTAGNSLDEIKKLDTYVLVSHPGNLLHRVQIYWQRWANKMERDYADLNENVIKLFKHSLLIIRTQVDVNGAILAANDSDILQFNRDHYSYMWPRDGALVAYSMSMAGYQSVIVPFFHFCMKALTPEGYLLHKYNPDGTVGSSWHPYYKDGKQQLPIQEDETALVLYALWQDYLVNKDVELPQSLYSNLIRSAARFLCTYIDPQLQLPQPSYDLWEERYGIFTFTTSAVYGGLIAAANFAKLFGDDERSKGYADVAENIKQGMLRHLWNEEYGRFARGLVLKDGVWVQDMTLESSMYGIFEFGVLPANDEKVVKTMTAIKQGLAVQTSIGGIARYYNDYYFQRSVDTSQIPGNPWIICTLWVAEWEIECAASLEELDNPRKTLEWVVNYALESGILPEQIDPMDGSPISVAPLTWSHATFVLTVVKYLNKDKELKRKLRMLQRSRAEDRTS